MCPDGCVRGVCLGGGGFKVRGLPFSTGGGLPFFTGGLPFFIQHGNMVNARSVRIYWNAFLFLDRVTSDNKLR